MSTRIHWSTAERALINQALTEAFIASPMLTRREALSRAQLVLPYERRRKITDQVVYNERPMIEAAQVAAEKAPKPEPAPVSAPVVEQPPVNPLLKIFDDLLDALADRIAERLRPQMTQAEVKQHIGAEFDTQFKRYKLEATPPKPRKPSVLIIGLNGVQMTSVSRNYPDVKFTFMTGEEAASRSQFHADHTILMTKFINHSAQNKYRQAPNLHYCNGGVSDLSTTLYMIQKAGV